MLTKIEIIDLINKIELSPILVNYIENLLKNFGDEDVIYKEKLRAIFKILENL